MKASQTLLKPFLVGVFNDICELFPENGIARHHDALLDLLDSSSEQRIVSTLASVGKALEKSLITGCNLKIAASELIPLHCGTVYPEFFCELWEELFYNDGLPHFRITCLKDGLLDDGLDLPVTQFALSDQYVFVDGGQDQSVALQNRKACVVLCLRQFYLGCSKLSTLECLQLGRAGDFRLQRENHTTTKDLLGRLLHHQCGSLATYVVLLRRREAAALWVGAVPFGPFWLPRTRCRI